MLGMVSVTLSALLGERCAFHMLECGRERHKWTAFPSASLKDSGA